MNRERFNTILLDFNAAELRRMMNLLNIHDNVDDSVFGEVVMEVLAFRNVDPDLDTLDRYIREGRKIQAIKLYRHTNGVTLRESKEFVDARCKELGM